jgi:uncharacterized protein YjbI with pentapeptide repeats
MKKTLLLSIILLVSFTVNADIYTWTEPITLLTTKDAVSFANLDYEFLEYADLADADLSYAQIRYADLQYADLRNTDLRFADLADTDLTGADLTGADLSFTVAADSIWANTILSGANLTNTYFAGSDLSGADLSGTLLVDVDLNNVVLSGANLTGTDLFDTIMWEYANYTDALYDYDTIFPDGFDPVAKGMILVPEPATLSLLALGGLTLLRKRK